MDIAEIKKNEMVEIQDFCDKIQEFGHIFMFDPKTLDNPFRKILEGINEVHKLMDDSYGM
jgi:hypothetical protein